MSYTEAEKLFDKGLDALTQGNTVSALSCFERAVQMEDNPLYSSYLAYCIARERGQFQLAVTLCEKAMARAPKESPHYLNLGKIYLIAGKRVDAIRTFREGLRHENNQQIIDELDKLGTRKPPVIPFLKRHNFINKYLGIIFKRLGLR